MARHTFLASMGFILVVAGCRVRPDKLGPEIQMQENAASDATPATEPAVDLAVTLEETLLHPVPFFRGNFFVQQGGTKLVLSSDPSGGRGGPDTRMPQTVWDEATRQVVFSTTGYQLNEAAALSPDGRFLACGYATLTVLTVPEGKVYRRWYKDDIDRMARARFHPDGKRIVMTSGPRVHVWDLHAPAHPEQPPMGEFVGHAGDRLPCLTLSSDGRLAMSGDRSGTAILWDVDQLQVVRRFPRTPIRQYQPDSRILPHGLQDAPAEPPPPEPKGMPGVDIWAVAFFPDASKAVVAEYAYGGVSVYEIGTGRRLARFDTENKNQSTRNLAVSPDGRYIVIGFDVPVVWDWRKNRIVAELSEHSRFDPSYVHPRGLGNLPRGTCNGVAFTSDGSRLITGGIDGTLRFWRFD